MKIRDISIQSICKGKNWRFVPPNGSDWLALPMEEWGPIEDATEFQPDDTIVYSGLVVYSSGRVKPIICLKEVQDADIGGDFCEFVGGQWQQIGLKPDPDTELRTEYIAYPLENDPSFDSSDNSFRDYHRNGFRQHVSKLISET